MSSAQRELELDQQTTSYSLLITRNIFSKVGLNTCKQIPSSLTSRQTSLSTEATSDPSLVSPSNIRIPLSPNKPSSLNGANFTFGGEDKGEGFFTTIIEENSPRSENQTPASKSSGGNGASFRREFSLRVNVVDDEEAIETNEVIATVVDTQPDYDDNYPHIGLIAREEVTNRLCKEGWLEKKAATMLVGWQKRYFEIRPFKICYAKSPEMLKAEIGVRAINLLVTPCQLIDIKETSFGIKVDGVASVLRLRTSSFHEAVEWIDFLKEMFRYAKEHAYEKGKYHNEKRRRISKASVVTEEDFLEVANTGDIVLSKHTTNPNKKQWKYDHVALVMKVNNQTYIYDAVCDKGARLYTWKNYKKIAHLNQKGKLVVCHRLIMDNPEDLEVMRTRICRYIMMHQIMKKDVELDQVFNKLILLPESPEDKVTYEYERRITSALQSSAINSASTAAKSSGSIGGSPTEKAQVYNEDESYSAKLIAAVYKQIGLLDAHVPIDKYVPDSFTKKVKLLRQAHLSEEYELALIKQEKE